MLATELAFDEQAPELSDAVRFDDLFRMELEDETSAEVGDDRDVVPSTVRDNAMRARRDLGV